MVSGLSVLADEKEARIDHWRVRELGKIRLLVESPYFVAEYARISERFASACPASSSAQVPTHLHAGKLIGRDDGPC